MRVFKLLALVFWLLGCYLLAWPAKRLGKLHARDAIAQAAYRGVLRIIGIRVIVSGALTAQRPLLLVTNHISYFDPHILGAQAPVRFTPKSEIAGWPGIGSICRLLDCVFIDRKSQKTKEAMLPVLEALQRGEIICLFPEASTGDGVHLLSFKSSFFSLAEQFGTDRPLTIQPAAITYTRARHLPIERAQWPKLAWYGDMELLPHLWELLKLTPLQAELVFLPPFAAMPDENRKALAARCQEEIASAIRAVRRG